MSSFDHVNELYVVMAGHVELVPLQSDSSGGKLPGAAAAAAGGLAGLTSSINDGARGQYRNLQGATDSNTGRQGTDCACRVVLLHCGGNTSSSSCCSGKRQRQQH